ncbi:NAD-dependent epimerase/dehydratase family protein [bacterium]|nr:NAD-dependent epimerase/dehydratase family protein [bacterium]
MGFLGSNLAIALVERGARVTLVDAMIDAYGGNPFNIAPVADRVIVNYCDIRDPNAMNYLVRDQDIILHLAGQVDHILSIVVSPFDDIDINVKGTAVVLEACRRYAPNARLIYTGTRGQYGRPHSLPVAEDAPTLPLGIYELTNLAAEKMVQIYQQVHGLRAVPLRITNVYGPRGQMKHSRYGVANWFVRLALDGLTIPVFGDGTILRDFLYVDDCVEAILACTASDTIQGEIFNVGAQTPYNFVDLADAVIRAVGHGQWTLTEFSPERKAQEPGSFYCDITKIREQLGWTPTISLDEGLARTVSYYREHRQHYW